MLKKVYKWSMAIFLCVVGVQNSFAQSEIVDSLKVELKSDTKADTNTVKILIELAARVYRSTPDTAKMYAVRAVELSEKLRFKKGEAEGYRYWGGAYFTEGRMDSALIYYEQSLELHKERKNMGGIASAQASVGIVYAVQDQFKEAIFYFIEATKTYELLENYTALSIMYNNVGNLYLEQELYEEAYQNYLKALNALEKGENKQRASLIYNNTALVLKELGKEQEALEFVELGISNAMQYNDRRSLGSLHLTAGNIRKEHNEFEAALDEYEAAKKIYIELGVESSLVEIGFHIAEIKAGLGNRREARQELLSIVDKFDQDNIHLPRLKSDAYELLARLEMESGNGLTAGEYALLAKSISDSLYKEENLKTISEIQTKYETEKKEQEIKVLEAEAESSRLKWILGLCVSSLILIVVLLIYRQRTNRKAKEKEYELNLVRRELSNYGHLIAEKDSFLNDVIDRMKSLYSNLKTIDARKELNSMLTELQQNVSLTDGEEQLFQRIEQVNSGFFKELELEFGDLTKSEKRLASLVQMGLSNKEIGGILQINSRSVVQARYRLKKKLGLESDTKLFDLLNKLVV